MISTWKINLPTDFASILNSIYIWFIWISNNPEIIETSGEQTGEEGCLSLPGKSGVVTRPNYVKVKALDRDFDEIIVEGEELLARALCHECEHLDGHMYVEKVEGELHDSPEPEEMEE